MGITLLPFARRTITATHAVALMMLFAMNLPAEGGLGVRRLQWHATASNEPSMGLSRKMGFKQEGTTRYGSLLQEGREGGRGLFNF